MQEPGVSGREWRRCDPGWSVPPDGSPLDREIEAVGGPVQKIRDSVDKLREYRMALISAAVTGKIDVRGEVA
jgi:hypothetical protein